MYSEYNFHENILKFHWIFEDFFIFSVASEIQNIQIGEGDVCRGVAIPVYMLFPRLFTCATTIAPNFKIGECCSHLVHECV